MVQCINAGESIECIESSLTARKFIKSNLVKKEKIGQCFKFKAQINCIAKIVKELNPKKFIINEKSFLDLGDYLTAECIEIFFKGKYSTNLISNYSSTHGIQNEIISGYVYAHIVIPMKWVLEKKLSAI